jgi:hypothetical protein
VTFLFGDIREKLRETSFDDPDDLLMTINDLCASIEEVNLEMAFLEWRERLAKCLLACGGLAENT